MATYVFQRPKDLSEWSKTYVRVEKKHQILKNMANIAEELHYVCRIVRGSKSRSGYGKFCCEQGNQ
jgi:hypothetical protein